MLTEAKAAGYAKQAPVFKDVPKQMKAAGMAASSRDAMIFITQVLSRLDIITPEVYDMTIKGQHRERMEKLMTILRSKEKEINAKSDEIVEYINQNLDNYTAGAGTDRNRAEKYKETAKAMSQEVQNIKAGKEADDALRDIVKTADQDTIESLEFSAEDTSTIIEINAGNVANVDRIRSEVEKFANDLGVEVTGNIVEFSVDEGSQLDQMVKKNGVAETEGFFKNFFKGDYPVTVSIIPPAGADEKERVQATADAFKAKPEGIEGREHIASVGAAADKFLKKRGIEDGEGKHDDGDDVDEKCDYVPCEDGEHGCEGEQCPDCMPKEDGEVTQLDPAAMETIDVMIGAAMDMEDVEYPEVKGMVEAGLGRACTDEECAYLMDELGVDPYDFELEPEDNEGVSVEEFYDGPDPKQKLEDEDELDPEFKAAYDELVSGTEHRDLDHHDIERIIKNRLDRDLTPEESLYIREEEGVGEGMGVDPFTGKEVNIHESKYTTADNLVDIYATVKPIVEVVVERYNR